MFHYVHACVLQAVLVLVTVTFFLSSVLFCRNRVIPTAHDYNTELEAYD